MSETGTISGSSDRENEAVEYFDDLAARARAWSLELQALTVALGGPPNTPKGAPTAPPRRHLRVVGGERKAA